MKPKKDQQSRQTCELTYDVRLAELDLAHGVKTAPHLNLTTKFVQIADSIIQEKTPLPFNAKDVSGFVSIIQRTVASQLADSKLVGVPLVGKATAERMMQESLQEINLILQAQGMPIITDNYAGKAIDEAKKPPAPTNSANSPLKSPLPTAQKPVITR